MRTLILAALAAFFVTSAHAVSETYHAGEAIVVSAFCWEEGPATTLRDMHRAAAEAPTEEERDRIAAEAVEFFNDLETPCVSGIPVTAELIGHDGKVWPLWDSRPARFWTFWFLSGDPAQPYVLLENGERMVGYTMLLTGADRDKSA